MAPLLLLLLAAAPLDPLAAAQRDLERHQPEKLVLDLADDVPLLARQDPEAAGLLARAAREAERGKDPVLALQLAQMAHRRDGQNAEAVAVLAELALADRSFVEAEQQADLWRKLAPADAHATLLRARIAAIEGDPETLAALAPALAEAHGLGPAEQKEAKQLAEKGKAAATQVTNTSAAIEARLREAAEAAERERKDSFAAREQVRAEPEVVLYGTSWCHFCKKAREFFESRHIAFEDKDIEADRDAGREMMEKARALGMRPTGVPVIDVRGTLVEGFDQAKIERLLAP